MTAEPLTETCPLDTCPVDIRPVGAEGIPRISEIFDRVATSVAVVTTATRFGPVGLTVSSFCSLSARPPALLACVSAGSRTAGAIRGHEAFGLNVLGPAQASLADRFAGADPATRFRGVSWAWLDDVPAISDTVVSVRCALSSVLACDGQLILVGSPTVLQTGPLQPLIRLNRRYSGSLGLLDAAGSIS